MMKPRVPVVYFSPSHLLLHFLADMIYIYKICLYTSILVAPCTPPALRKHIRRRGGKNVRAGELGGVPWNAVLWTWPRYLTYEHLVAVVIHKRPEDDQACRNSCNPAPERGSFDGWWLLGGYYSFLRIYFDKIHASANGPTLMPL